MIVCSTLRNGEKDVFLKHNHRNMNIWQCQDKQHIMGWVWDCRIPAGVIILLNCVVLRWNPTGLLNSGSLFFGNGRCIDFQTGLLCCHLNFKKQLLSLKINNIIKRWSPGSLSTKLQASTKSCTSAPRSDCSSWRFLVGQWLGCPLGSLSRCESLCLHLVLVFQEVSPFGEIFHPLGGAFGLKLALEPLAGCNIVFIIIQTLPQMVPGVPAGLPFCRVWSRHHL